MDEMKHTPGPWTASGNGVHVYKNKVGLCVAVSYDPHDMTSRSNPPVAQANARLIAAAPEMLEILQAVQEAAAATANYIGQDGQLIKKVMAVIAKAKGEEFQ